MTRKQLAKVLAAKTKLKNKQAEDLIIAFGNIVGDTLSKNKKIVYSNFGTFYTVHYPSKIIYHPKLGKAQKMVMLPTDVAKWMPSENIKKMVDSGVEVENATVHGRKNIRQIRKNPAPEKQKPASDFADANGIINEEEVEVPIKINRKTAAVEDEKPIDIYEEKLDDGSKFESTFSDAIRIQKPKAKNFFGRVFGKKDAEEILPDVEKEIPISSFQKTKPVSYFDLSGVSVPAQILQKIPKTIASRYKIVPIAENDFELTVATTDPENFETKEIIKKLAGKEIVVGISSEADINRIIGQYPDTENAEEKIIDAKTSADNTPAARMVTSLLRNAVREKASDIHIEPKEKEIEIRFRVDGVLEKKSSLSKNIQPVLASKIKTLANIPENEFYLPQDGRFSCTVDDRQIDFYVSTIPVTYGEKIVVKVLDKENNFLKLEQLGIEENELKILNNNLKKSAGMILVCGPAQSGKTTTLYSLIDKIYHDGIDIVTLEDPIECRMPGINQSQVDIAKNYTFASGLRSIVRQDSDVIMVSEIADGETFNIAAHAALKGKIIFSAMHAKNTADVFEKLLGIGTGAFLLASSINCVVGQRLVRKICGNCKEEAEISDEIKKEIKREIEKMPAATKKEIEKTPLKFYRGHGCKTCDHSGFKGKIGLFEILNVDETVKNSIINEKIITDKITTIIQDGIAKALAGQTTIEEVLRALKE